MSGYNASEDTKVPESAAVGTRFTLGYLTYEVTGKGEVEVHDCDYSAINVNVPKYVCYNNYNYIVKSIGDWTFYSCFNLSNIVMSDYITHIGNSAFYKCSHLEKIDLHNGITYIGNCAFEGCTNLSSLSIPDTIVTINNSVFCDCENLEKVQIGQNVNTIEPYAFFNCKNLKYINIPCTVTTLDTNCFAYCRSLSDIAIPENVSWIWDSFFHCSNLNNISVDSRNKCFTSEDGVLYNKNKTSIICYPAGKENSFFVIPKTVTTIASDSFIEASNIKCLFIPKSVTMIEVYAFDYCNNLNEVYYEGTPDEWNNIKIDTYYNSNTELLSSTIHYNYSPHEHSYTEEITKQPTCTEEGEKTFTCDCGDTYTETIPAKGHTEVIDKAVPATCTADGKTEGSHCSVCGEVIKAQTVIKATGHKYDDGKITKQPTCTKDGEKTFTCDCGDTYTETIPAKGHTAVTDKAVPATCTTDGKTEGSHCSVCGEVIKAQTVIKATGHKYDDGKITKQPTCTETGVKTFTCSECGATKTETIKAADHKSSGWIIDKQPAVGVKGSKHKECTVCGKILEKAEIPALAATDISGASVKLSTTSYTYNGKAKKPTVTVTLNGKTLKKNVDYTVKYSSNTAIGKAKITITGKGNYKGTVSKTFKILPAKQTIAKITSQKKGFAVKWTKDTNVTGYRIQYDVKSDFKSAKSTYVKTNTTYKKTISGLKAKKTYYVRVRSYKTVGGVKYYGSWSAVKSVKTK